jgi:DNA polymerase
MTDLIGLDFETYGAINLPRYGLHRYVNNDTFTPLLAAVAWTNKGKAESELLDFTLGYERYQADRDLLGDLISGRTIVAHNASFEQAVLGWMGMPLPSSRFIDSAVLARAAGGAGKLEAAAPQLLGTDKLEVGADLIQLFSVPGKYQAEGQSLHFDARIRLEFQQKWAQFGEYCRVDAALSLRLALLLLPIVSNDELANTAVTMSMNMVGWHVDLELVEEMQRRYEANLAAVEAEFRTATGAFELNLNSNKQLQAWCRKRKVRASSFDEAHVERLITRLEKHMSMPGKAYMADGYAEVVHLLRTKQALGGSSLKKLQVILDTTGEDGRLRDQYLHIGAGATYRTTGRGVQMQNLKRLNGGGSNMEELLDPTSEWDNGELAANVRQVFTASDPAGRLIVGDFASVESRGLAWQGGEEWKLQSYRWGQDLYKVQAGLIFGKPAIDVTKDERQIGKVGELACGYGAGPDAVKAFASKMGVELTEGESVKLVKDWRAANPQIVRYWYALDDAMHRAVEHGVTTTVDTPHGWVMIQPVVAPRSLRDQVKDQKLVSLKLELKLSSGETVLRRVIHGVHLVGRNLRYWKPSERKTGQLWSDQFTNPKTKQLQKYHVYGGKLAGLLTQSLCREVFFGSLRQMHEWVQTAPNVWLVGQFHDEIVLDWVPGPVSLSGTKAALEQAMTSTVLPGFPLAAEIKDDYRYTK